MVRPLTSRSFRNGILLLVCLVRCPISNTGGVIILVQKHFIGRCTNLELTTVHQGRIVQLKLVGSDSPQDRYHAQRHGGVAHDPHGKSRGRLRVRRSLPDLCCDR